MGYNEHRFSSKENNENMREIATNQNILSSTKKSQKPDPESVFFIVPIRQKSLKEIPKALNFRSITDKTAQYPLSAGGVFVSFQPQKKT